MAATVDEIVSYWAETEDECGLGVDWAEAHERCWRCGYKTILEKCHIIPAKLGGGATPNNLVLLCSRCHREAPNHQNPEYMWRWLRSTCVSFYDTYWTIRGWEEFEVMFGRKPLDWIGSLGSKVPDLAQEFEAEIEKEFRKTVIHFGEGRLNPSTVACVLAEIEQTVASRHGVTLPVSPTIRALRGFMSTLSISPASTNGPDSSH